MIKSKLRNLKILFFGLGSIGKKHARIIKDNYHYELYSYRTHKGQEKSDLKIKEFKNLNDAFSINPDIAFITNPTYLHVQTALECVKRNINLFIEKPVSHSLEKTNELYNEIRVRKLFTYVAYNMRFNPVLMNLKNIILREEKPIYFRVTCSSYLPNWRPKQDYKKSYSANDNLGGGVILDLSHEFDYISWIIGEIKKIAGTCGKISNLNIFSEDFIEAQITCNSNIKGNLHLDCFSKKQERKIQIYFNDRYIEGDLINNKIMITTNKEKQKVLTYKCNLDESYEKQIKYYFKQYHNNNFNLMNNFSEALKIFNKIMEFKNMCHYKK